MNKKFIEYSTNSVYKSDYVDSFMKKNDLLPKE